MDLRDELERAIGDGPPLPAPEVRLATGRRMLRRRRAGLAAGAVAAVGAVVLPVVVLAGGAPTTGVQPTPAAPATSTDPTTGPTTGSTPRPSRAPYVFTDSSVPAEVDHARGEVRIRPGAVVHERRRDIFPGKETESLALDLTWRGERYWVVLEWDRGGGGATYTGPGDGFVESFDAFVEREVAAGGMQPGVPIRAERPDEAPVPGRVVGLQWDGQGLVASGDTEILEQRTDVDLGRTFASGADTTGAALVRMAGDRQLVLYREVGGDEGQLIAVLSGGHGDTLDELLAWARERYESGEGLL